jgi:hypothetical protein
VVVDFDDVGVDEDKAERRWSLRSCRHGNTMTARRNKMMMMKIIKSVKENNILFHGS